MAKEDKMSIRFKQLFASSNGKKVLEDLRKQCGFDNSSVIAGDVNPHRVLFNEGKRSIYIYIKRKMENE